MYFVCSYCKSVFHSHSDCLAHESICEAELYQQLCDVCGRVLTEHAVPCRADEGSLVISDHEAELFLQLCDVCGCVLAEHTAPCRAGGSLKRIRDLNDEESHDSVKRAKVGDEREQESSLQLEEGLDRPCSSSSSDQTFSVISTSESYNAKFKLRQRKLRFKINFKENPLSDLERGVEEVITFVKRDCKASDLVGITFSCNIMNPKEPGYVSFRPLNEITPDMLWGLISGMFQSSKDNENCLNDFSLEVTNLIMPHGGMPRKSGASYDTFSEECLKRRGLIHISNKDSLCLARSVVVGKALSDGDLRYNEIRKNTDKIQDRLTNDLIERSGIQFPPTGSGVLEIQQLQRYLEDYQITVYRHGTKGRDTIFVGPPNSKRINILYSDGHYCTIASLTAAFACSYYCHECHIPYQSKDKHLCKSACRGCYSRGCIEGDHVTCRLCNREMISLTCYSNHLTSICKIIKKCNLCFKTYKVASKGKRMKTNQRSVHSCSEIFCRTCDAYRDPNHLCFMRVDTRSPPNDNYLFIYFDLETTQEDPYPSGMLHQANLCVFRKSCSTCIGSSITTCPECSVREIVLKDNNPVEKLVSYVLGVRDAFKHVCVLSHCGGAFDMQFILKYLLEKKYSNITPNIIKRGTKLLLLEFGNVRFIDSFQYFNMALAKLPEAFGFEGSKGYFPHLFNTLENARYKGALPDKSYYNPDGMFKADKEKFEIWYSDNRDMDFDMESEIVTYCKMDVEILQKACEKFRCLFLQECNVDPFLESMTLASACNLMFRRNFLQPDTIGIIPTAGYREGGCSIAALRWLESLEETNGPIQHGGRGKEKILLGAKVDGYKSETKEVFQFHGCYFHGCTKCYPRDRQRPLSDDPRDTMESRFTRTQRRTAALRRGGFIVIERWGCERLQANAKGSDHPFLFKAKLDPREAFFGGRTENYMLHYKCTGSESIRYVDVCSLYPWVCKYGKFPVGHPIVHVGNVDISTMEGLVKCSILPPRNLLRPVLPMKGNGKLLFCLCRTCALEQYHGECVHTEEERTLTGTWVIVEVRKAIEKGYLIKEVHEVWEYKVRQYPNGLFSGFINKFLKIKQEASGWPKTGMNDVEKETYIQTLLEKEGVHMDIGAIRKNPGMRSLAKLMLNSFWGRFGMRSDHMNTTIITEPHILYTHVTDPSKEICQLEPVNDHVVLCSWRRKDEAVDASSTTNVVIAAFTTAQARLKLYDELDKVGDRAVYGDTDSLFYISREGDYDIPTGTLLGDWTDELDGDIITEMVCGGPKTYAYVTDRGRQVCKVKGFTLNSKNSKVINFSSLKRTVLERGVIKVACTQIVRDKHHNVFTRDGSKRLTPHIGKGRLEGFKILPFGYYKL